MFHRDPDPVIFEEVDFDDAPAAIIAQPRIRLRNYQSEAIASVAQGWATYGRQLLDMATGTGKTSIFSAIAAEWHKNGRKTLILENRDALVRQTAKRIKDETGIDAAIEMAGEHASPFAPVVVASVMSLCRDHRLTGFSDEHFGLVVADESHHSLAASWAKVLAYFHYGAESLAENWFPPEAGTYSAKAMILGVTATPELASKRSLGEFFQAVAYQYQLIQAVADGWLVPPVTKNIPLKIDIRGLRPGRTPNGSDFKTEDLAKTLVPVLEALAKQIAELASDRKSICFVPSIQCAELLAAALNRYGINGIFVSGACLDVDEKTDRFRKSGRGTVLCNAALYVEGADFPDIDCVICARATKSTAFYRQQVGRGTRVLPGTVDGLPTPEARRAAIAASKKPDLLILDPLWISDRIDLCDAYDLFTDKPEVKAAMKVAGDLSPESAQNAERDFLASLEKEARKHARKKGRTIDPLAWAVSLGDDTLTNYKPETTADARPPTPGQLGFLQRNHIDAAHVTCQGMANKIIKRFLNRMSMKLATPQQLTLLKQLGLPENVSATMSISEASGVISRKIRERR